MDKRRKFLRVNGVDVFLPAAGVASGQQVLGLEEGPGYVEVASPGVACRWRVDHPCYGGQTDQTWIETGPASRAWAPIGANGGKVVVDRVWYSTDPIALVDPSDGTITDVVGHLGAHRALVVRYWPAAQEAEECRRDGQALIRSPTLSPPLVASSMTIPLEIAAQTTITLGYPPDRRHVLSIISSLPLSIIEHWGCISGGVTTGAQILATPAAAVQTRNVAPGVLIRLVNPGGVGAQVLATWRSHTAIREN